MSPPPVFVITGQLAAGKSTVARALLARFPFGFLIDVDAVREMVVTGLASPIHWTDETSRQFDLAVHGSVALAAVYHAAGFAVAVEGAIDPVAIDGALREAGLRDAVVGVVLHPAVEAALARNRDRGTKPFDPAILEPVIRRLDADLTSEGAPAGWTVIDNGAEPVDATVERVLALVR